MARQSGNRLFTGTDAHQHFKREPLDQDAERQAQPIITLQGDGTSLASNSQWNTFNMITSRCSFTSLCFLTNTPSSLTSRSKQCTSSLRKKIVLAWLLSSCSPRLGFGELPGISKPPFHRGVVALPEHICKEVKHGLKHLACTSYRHVERNG